MSWTKTAAYDENQAHFRDQYIQSLRALMTMAKSYNVNMDGNNITAFQPLIGELESALNEAKELLNHEHEWTSIEEPHSSYCILCGMPGDI